MRVIGLLCMLLAAPAWAIEGPYPDPGQYPMGWSSAHHATSQGENCIIFTMGHKPAGGGGNESVRCFRPESRTWVELFPHGDPMHNFDNDKGVPFLLYLDKK